MIMCSEMGEERSWSLYWVLSVFRRRLVFCVVFFLKKWWFISRVGLYVLL